MNMDRLQQLVAMFAAVTERSFAEARNIILTTDTGKAILNNNAAALYEQQTENLESIALELKQNGQYAQEAALFTKEAIVSVMQILTEYEKQQREKRLEQNFCAHREEDLRKNLQQKTSATYKIVQKQKYQNQVDARRVQYADNIKR